MNIFDEFHENRWQLEKFCFDPFCMVFFVSSKEPDDINKNKLTTDMGQSHNHTMNQSSDLPLTTLVVLWLAWFSWER
jgi:hypothetical protein